MQTNALWTLDNETRTEKAFCCIHSNARDFSKLGQLLLQKGNWNGQQLLDSNYVKQATHPDIAKEYGFSMWMDYENKYPFYMFRGHLGQYVIVIPSHNMIVVRLGEDREFWKNPNPTKVLPQHIYNYVTEAINMGNKMNAATF